MTHEGKRLTPKQHRFVAEYLKDLNATQAAIRTGYSPKTAQPASSRLLSNVMVAAAIAEGRTQLLAEIEADAVETLREVARLGRSDIRSYFDATGNMKPVTAWTDAQAAAVASVETVIKNAAAGDGHTDRILKLKLWDKNRALEMLMKHFGQLIERHQHEVRMTLEDLVDGSRLEKEATARLSVAVPSSDHERESA